MIGRNTWRPFLCLGLRRSRAGGRAVRRSACLLAIFAIALSSTVPPGSSWALENTSLPDYRELTSLLKSGDFDRIEAVLSQYQRDFLDGRHSDEVVAAAFQTFATTDPGLQSSLDAWVQARPDSYVPWLARGIYHWHRGWAARAHAWGAKTPQQRFGGMARNFALAELDIKSAIQRNRRLSVAYALQIDIHMAMGRLAGMKWAQRRGLTVVPTSREIRRRYLYGLLPKWLGEIVDIERYVTELRREHTDDPHLASLQGYPAYARADLHWRGLGPDSPAQARPEDGSVAEDFDRALSYGQDLWIIYERGNYKLERGDVEAALADANRLLAEWPQNARYLDFRARVYRRMDRIDQALSDWSQAIELDPLETYFLKNRASMYRQLKRFKDALADLDDALYFGRYDDALRAERGSLLLYDMHEADKAVSEFRRATALAPAKAVHWYNLTAALYRRLDCEFVHAGRKYLELCREKPICAQGLSNWVKGAITAEVRHKACPG
jgi:tetratricopeptide (TPR) repeat protein